MVVGMKELQFDETTHTYTVGGAIIPSVTEIVSPLGINYDDLGELELCIEAAAERGVILHEVLAMILSGESIEDIECPDSYGGYIDAITAFLSEHDILPLAIEEPIFDTALKVAGTPDLLCELNGDLSIVDYKFVSQITSKMKTKYKAQLNGYREIYLRQGVFPDKLYIVQFLSAGNYRVYPVAIGPEEFMMCLKLHEMGKRKHPRGMIV